MKERVAITGSKGQIGTVLKNGLGPNYEITPINLPDHDVRDIEDLQKILPGHRVVIHLAWDSGDNFRSGDFNPENDIMFRNVYIAALNQGVKRVIMASSVHADSFYGRGPFKADSPTTPDSPYGAEKILMETLGHEFAKKGLEVICIRFGAVSPQNKPFEVTDPNDPFQTSERAVWFSHKDCISLIEKCIEAEQIPGNFVIIYGISNNSGIKHDISNPFGWAPQDNADNV